MKNFEYEKIDCSECGGIEELYCSQCKSICEFRTEDWGCMDAVCKVCNNKGEILSDYIIVTDPKVKILFKDCEFIEPKEWMDDGTILEWYEEVEIFDEDLLGIETYLFTDQPIKIHKSVVKEICEPVEGDAVIVIINNQIKYIPVWDGFEYIGGICIKANALSIGLPSEELKTLHNFYKDES